LRHAAKHNATIDYKHQLLFGYISPLFIARAFCIRRAQHPRKKDDATIKARRKTRHAERKATRRAYQKSPPRRFYYRNRKVKVNDHLRLVRRIYDSVIPRGITDRTEAPDEISGEDARDARRF